MGAPNHKPILIIGAGLSGLLLAQHLRKINVNIPVLLFERDADLTTRGLGWGLTLHWSLPALRALLPEDLFARLPEAYVDRAAVEEGRPSTFPFFDLSTGECKAKTPNASVSQRIRVTRDRLRRVLATGLDIQVCDSSSFFCVFCCVLLSCKLAVKPGWADCRLVILLCCNSGIRQSTTLRLLRTELSQLPLTMARPMRAASLWPVMAAVLASAPCCFQNSKSIISL